MNSEESSLFKKIDQALERQISNLELNQLSSQLNDLFDHLNPEVRKVLSQITGLVIISFPLFICLIFFIINFNAKSDFETKQQIMTISQKYLQEKSQTQLYGKKIIADRAISSEQEFLDIVKNNIQGEEATNTIFKLQDFTQEETTPQIIKTSAQIDFEEINLTNLMKIIKDNLKNSSIKISDIDIKKVESGKLSGLFRAIQYAILENEKEK